MTDGPGCLVTSTPADDGSVVAGLVGELDAETAAAVRDQLFALIEPGRLLVLDLSGLEFLDSSGLSVLVLALTRARAVAGQLVVRNPTARVRRLIETSRLVGLFGLSDDGANGKADGPVLRPVRDPEALAELRSLLVGFENLLRWGDLRPEQVTLALDGMDPADETSDLVLAARVRDALALLGDAPAVAPDEDA